MEDLSGRMIGQYRIIEPIGTGGMAAVFKAYQPSLDRYVAVKVLPAQHAMTPGFTERFTREAKAVAQLNHPNILPIHDFGQDGDLSYIVMKYVPAGTLKDRLGAPLELSEAARLIGQIAGALDHAHGRGILHRDIKPGNVLLDEGDWVLLTDFGLARMVEGTSKLTGTGVGVGTPAYMSPEQGQGEKVDARTDIYSLGIILYEMATGHVPFTADTPLAVVIKHITDPLPIPRTINPDVPEGVERVILKALAKNPEDRYDSAGELAAALNTALEEADTKEVRVPGAAPAVQKEAPGQEMPTQAVGVGAGTKAAPKPTPKEKPAPGKTTGRMKWAGIIGGVALLAFIGLCGICMVAGAAKEQKAKKTATAEAAHPETPIPLLGEEGGEGAESVEGTEGAEGAEGETTPEDYYRMGEDAFDNLEYEAAVEHLTNAIEHGYQPASNAYYLRALCHVELGNRGDAVKDFNWAESLDFEPLAELCVNRAYVNWDLEEYQAVVDDLTCAIENDYENPAEAYLYRGVVYAYDLENYEQGLADINKAIELGCGPEAYRERGIVYISMGGHDDEALADLHKYLELVPDAEDRADIEDYILELEGGAQ